MRDLNHDPTKGYTACSGCGLCVLVCPVWWQGRDLMMTPQGRAMSRQGGTPVEELAESIDACLLCGACEPACPEQMDTVGMVLTMRHELNEKREKNPAWYPNLETPAETAASLNRDILLLAESLAELFPRAFVESIKLLGGPSKVARGPMDLRPLSTLWQAGLDIPDALREAFIASVKGASMLVVEQGHMLRPLRTWLPGIKVVGIGEALQKCGVSWCVQEQDLLVIESSAYNMQQPRLVGIYDRLRKEVGCELSLDLQRMAISCGANSLQGQAEGGQDRCQEQARWVIKGKSPTRILVEDSRDAAVYAAITDVPVMHLAMGGEGLEE